MAEIGWQRGCAGLNIDNLAYKLRLNEEYNGLTRHEQALTCGLALEGGSDIVSLPDRLVSDMPTIDLIGSVFIGNLFNGVSARIIIRIMGACFSHRSDFRNHRLVNDLPSQERARAEIDAIHGEDTLPTWKDEQSLPFIRASKSQQIISADRYSAKVTNFQSSKKLCAGGLPFL